MGRCEHRLGIFGKIQSDTGAQNNAGHAANSAGHIVVPGHCGDKEWEVV